MPAIAQTSETVAPVLIAGQWRDAAATETFAVEDPGTRQKVPGLYPISGWGDCDAALAAAADAAIAMRRVSAGVLAGFLEDLAARIESIAEPLAQLACRETGLPFTPRLKDVELPRTTNQLRQAAAAAREGSWAMPTIDTAQNIRSMLAPLGPVCVFGPNNFPFAFNGIGGGDFAAAIAAGNPVIAKANPLHAGTTRMLAEQAHAAAQAAGLPAGAVQLLYRIRSEHGLRMVADPRNEAIAFTGSRAAGLKLKHAAESAGKLAYLEMSSINPVVFLPGALRERAEALAEQFTTSCLMGAGQFCTNPGLVLLVRGRESDAFIESVSKRFGAAAAGTLLSADGLDHLASAVDALRQGGAKVLAGGQRVEGARCAYANTLLLATGDQFLADPLLLQREAFGNASLIVVVEDAAQLATICRALEGNLTGCIYSATDGSDDPAYVIVEPALRFRVGRLLNDKMPTGVAVSPAMNHGGPYPATGHPGFTAVGIPASMRRFARLHSYDNVRPHRLPPLLADENPMGAWRLVDGRWTRDPITTSK